MLKVCDRHRLEWLPLNLTFPRALPNNIPKAPSNEMKLYIHFGTEGAAKENRKEILQCQAKSDDTGRTVTLSVIKFSNRDKQLVPVKIVSSTENHGSIKVQAKNLQLQRIF